MVVELDADRLVVPVAKSYLRSRVFRDNLRCALSYHYYFVQPSSYLPLAQVLPLGPWATPIPFLLLALPPLVV
jgi:hypothetical protein